MHTTHKSIRLCWALVLVFAAVINMTTNYENHKDLVVIQKISINLVCMYATV